MKSRKFAPLTILFVMSALLSSIASAKFPPTEKKPVSDEYHGIQVVDEYRWLEESGAPAVKTWTETQNAHTRAYLDALPDRAGIAARLTALFARDTPSHSNLVSRPG